jgi:hypothetical protein
MTCEEGNNSEYHLVLKLDIFITVYNIECCANFWNLFHEKYTTQVSTLGTGAG